MKKLAIFSVLFLVSIIMDAQGWEKIFGGLGNDIGKQVLQTTDGGYILVGEKASPYQHLPDVYLIKTDNAGDTLWTKTYGGEKSEHGSSVCQTTDGGYIVCGTKNGDWSSDIYLIRTDDNGDTLWTRTFGQGTGYDYGLFVQQTTDEGFIVSGSVSVYRDACLLKTDKDGNLIWQKTYDFDLWEIGCSVQQTSDGGFVTVGYSYTLGSYHSNIFLIKTNDIGDTIWTKKYDNFDFDKAYMVQQTHDGGYIIVGVTDSTMFGNFPDLYLIKTDSYGEIAWTKTYQLLGTSSYGFNIKQTSDYGFIVTGSTYSNPGYEDIFLLKLNNDGDSVWFNTFGNEGADIGYSVQQTNDGGYIVTGRMSVEGNDADIFLIKTDEKGSISSTIEIPISNPNRKLMMFIDLYGRKISNPQKNIPYIEIYDDGTIEKKILIK